MKNVYRSIAFILFLLLACLADSFGQTTFKIVHKIYDNSTKQYKVDFEVNKKLYVEYDNMTFIFHDGKNTNTIYPKNKISENQNNNILTTTYRANWDLTGEDCFFLLSSSKTISSYSIYFVEKGIKKALIFYFKN
jgi:hypothetical protein